MTDSIQKTKDTTLAPVQTELKKAIDTANGVKVIGRNNRDAIRNLLIACGTDLQLIRIAVNTVRDTAFPIDACIRVHNPQGKDTKSETLVGFETWCKALKYVGEEARPVPLVFNVDKDSKHILMSITTPEAIKAISDRKDKAAAAKKADAMEDKAATVAAEKLYNNALTTAEKVAHILKSARDVYGMERDELLKAITAQVQEEHDKEVEAAKIASDKKPVTRKKAAGK